MPNDSIAAQPLIKKKSPISAIWLLPIIALLLGGYLAYQSLSQAGIMISIHFPDGNGIIEDKTPVKYKGLVVGKVKTIEPDQRLLGVNVLVEMDPRAESALTRGTQFWLVRPQASLTRISGLDTILSGNYIAVQPGEGPKEREFEAVKEAPLQLTDDDLIVRLRTPTLGSLSVGSPVYYRHFAVGEVVKIKLDDERHDVMVQVQINSEYIHLVTKDSRFWNVSGVRVSAGISGVEVQTESLATIIAGGIAFDSPLGSDPLEAEEQEFVLYPSLDEADRGIQIALTIHVADGLALSGTEIRYLGVPIGTFENIRLSDDQTYVTGEAHLDPSLNELLGDDSQFWLVKPKISMAGIENLDTIVLGYRIQFSPATKPSELRHFKIQPNEPALPGSLNITLHAPNSYGLSAGKTIFYRGLTIGHIRDVVLSDDNSVEFDVVINPVYTHLVTDKSRFYVNSGIDVKASLRGLTIDTKPIEQVLMGGITLMRGNQWKDASPAKDGQNLALYSTIEAAVVGKRTKPKLIKIVSDDVHGLQAEAPVYFKDLPVGEILSVELNDQRKVIMTAGVQAKYAHLLNQSSRFWQMGGIKFKADLTGLEVQTGSLIAAALGGIAFDTPNSEASAKGPLEFELYSNQKIAMETVSVINIELPVSTSVTQGTKVFYGGFQIGEVNDIVLDPGLNHVNAQVYLEQLYADSFMRQSTQFWIESGSIGIDGVSNPKALLTGDFIIALPGTGATRQQFNAGYGAPKNPVPTDGITIYLESPALGSVKVGSPILFRQIQVGQVTSTELAEGSESVVIQANIKPDYSHLVRSNTHFWNVSGIKAEAGLFSGMKIQAESLTTIIAGGIAFGTPDNEAIRERAQQGSRFKLHAKAKNTWRQWQLTIDKD